MQDIARPCPAPLTGGRGRCRLRVEGEVVVAGTGVQRVGASVVPDDRLDVGGAGLEQGQGLGALMRARPGVGEDEVGTRDQEAGGAGGKAPGQEDAREKALGERGDPEADEDDRKGAEQEAAGAGHGDEEERGQIALNRQGGEAGGGDRGR